MLAEFAHCCGMFGRKMSSNRLLKVHSRNVLIARYRYFYNNFPKSVARSKFLFRPLFCSCVFFIFGGLLVFRPFRGVNGERAAVESWQGACTGGACAHVCVCVHLQLGVGEVWGFGGCWEQVRVFAGGVVLCCKPYSWLSCKHAVAFEHMCLWLAHQH